MSEFNVPFSNWCDISSAHDFTVSSNCAVYEI